MQSIVIGSQAGLEGFKEEMEKKEGKGAVDNELGYIHAMRSVREWARALQTQVPSTVILLEPGLVRTKMAEREFSSMSGINWSNVPSPDEYVNSSIVSDLFVNKH